MVGNRGRDTKPELLVRGQLFRLGLRFRVDFRAEKDLNRRADIAFPRAKLAVMIDGCFWHGCPTHYRPSYKNANYWSSKIARNKDRDADTNARLRNAGWLVLRFWEHEDESEVAGVIRKAYLARVPKS